MPTVPSKDQIRAARAMIDWSLIDLARAADVPVSSVLCFEMRGADALLPSVAGCIRRALERMGITFLADDGDGCGIRLRPDPRPDAAGEPTGAAPCQDTRQGTRQDARELQVAELQVDLGLIRPDSLG